MAVVDVQAAKTFIFANARLLERHRLAALVDGAPPDDVIATLRAYRNRDGGFGHALEPDVRTPSSEPASTLHALEVLAEVGVLEGNLVDGAAKWIAEIAKPDGGISFVLQDSAHFPHAPWMVDDGEASFLTFALAARLWEAQLDNEWRERASEWCWARLAHPDTLGSYWTKFALDFLDHVSHDHRVDEALERLRPQLREDGTLPVPGGTADEQLGPLDLSPRPGRASRVLFTADQVTAALDALEHGQAEDGGWKFDWLAWSPGQSVEWRGIVTFRALATLAAHGRF
jgi:hypothetical protein